MFIKEKFGLSISVGLSLIAALASSVSYADWTKDSYVLMEYTDPAYARIGTLDFWQDETLNTAPYGWPYKVDLNISGVCNPPTVSLNGGSVLNAWMYELGSDPSVIAQYDPYATEYAVFYYDYGPAENDGSVGEDYPCTEPGKLPRYGGFAIFVRDQNYMYEYDNTAGRLQGKYLHVADLLECSVALGCNWYYVLVPTP